MSIKIDWVDPNVGTTEYKIYRQETPILDNALPAPLVTLPGGTLTYTDTTVVRNKLYYYRVGAQNGSDFTLSPNKPLAYMPYTGPGPTELLRGDWALGFFGRVKQTDLFSIQEMKTVANNPSLIMLDNGMVWLKFVYKGKILFIASQMIGHSATWQSMYQAGVVYGDIPEANWPAWVKTNFGIIPQNKTMRKGDHLFNLRYPTSRAVMSNTGNAQADTTGGEFDKIIAYAYTTRFIPDTDGYGQLDDVAHASSMYSHTADVYGSYGVSRGGANVDNVTSNSSLTATSTALGWRPLLDLIL